MMKKILFSDKVKNSEQQMPAKNDYSNLSATFKMAIQIVFLLFLFIQPALALTVTSPSSSANWEIGTPKLIQWTDTYTACTVVDIDLYNGSSSYLKIAENYDTGGSNSYGWTVDQYANAGTNYRIKIFTQCGSGDEYGYSDYFQISNAPSTSWYSISGRVTLNGSALEGAKLTFDGFSEYSDRYYGDYKFENINEGKSGSLSISKSGYTFSPPSVSISSISADLTYNFTASSTLPSAPASLTATAASTSAINLSWSSVSGSTSYQIYKSNGTYVAETSSASYQITGLNADTQYCYKVKSCNSGGCSGYSGERCATTQSNVTYRISGKTKDSGGYPIGGATVTFTGLSSVTSLSDGTYRKDVSSGWSGTVSASKSGYTFSSVSISSVSGHRPNTDIIGSLTTQPIQITGSVSPASGEAGSGFQWTATATGGDDTAVSAFVQITSPSGQASDYIPMAFVPGTNPPQFTHSGTLSEAGTYMTKFRASQSGTNSYSGIYSEPIVSSSATPLNISGSVTPASGQAGSGFQWTATATGGDDTAVSAFVQITSPSGQASDYIPMDFVPGTNPPQFTHSGTLSEAGTYMAKFRASQSGSDTYSNIYSEPIVAASATPLTINSTVNPAGGQAGSITASPDKSFYEEGETVTLTAEPDSCYDFSGWSGDCEGVESLSCTLTMDSDKSVTANFAQKEHSLTVSATNGSVTRNPEDDDTFYPCGSTVQLTAMPDPGYEFDHWSDCDSINDKQCTVIMNSDKQVEAHFSEYKNSGLNIDIYPDDNWLPKRPTLYKAKKDLIDVVVSVENDTGEDQSGITIQLKIKANVLEPGFLHIYERSLPEDIPLNDTDQPNEISDYGEESVGGFRTIIINDLAIPKKSISDTVFKRKQKEFVFRFKLSDTLNGGDDILSGTEAELSGSHIKTSSKKLSDGGGLIKIVPNGAKIILTNRELMYRQFAYLWGIKNVIGVNQVSRFWESLYKTAEDRIAVIYHVDKYDRDDDGDRLNNITIEWLNDRDYLAHGSTEGGYHYGNDPASQDEPAADPDNNNEEEDRINQVAVKIKGLLRDFIIRSGDTGNPLGNNGRHVAIIGGDSIVPFYRVFDLSNTVFKYKKSHNATSVTQTDAKNNYFFSDIFYRDYDGNGWREGQVENIFVGRVTGTSAKNIRSLLLSSDRGSSNSNNVVKLENYARDCELTNFENSCSNKNYTVVTSVDNTTIDKANPKGACSWKTSSGQDDPARWSNDFKNLFTGKATNLSEFDIMRLMCHGSVSGVQDSEGDSYFSGIDISGSAGDISQHFSRYYPLFIFDACLVGLVDGKNGKQLFNSMLPLNVRGMLGASGVTWTPIISDFIDKFTEKILEPSDAGEALAIANKNFHTPFNADIETKAMYAYSRFQMNLFGLPWGAITPPNIRTSTPKRSGKIGTGNSSIRTVARDSSAKIIVVDSSDYHVESDTFDIVRVDGFDLLLEDENTPVVLRSEFTANIPLNAIVDSVDVTFDNPVDLGMLNIPAYELIPPMPGDEGGGYVQCPTDLGVFPPNQYSYNVSEIVGYNQVIVEVLPLVFDTDTKQATLYRTADIRINYTTPNKGIVRKFVSDKQRYGINEDIETTATVENISASSNNFSITLAIQDLKGNIISSDTLNQTIASNSSDVILVNLKAPLQSGPYQLVMTASDGSNTIGNLARDIQVAAGRISSFTLPDFVDSNNFTVEFENLSDSQTEALQDIYIYNVYNEEVAKLPQVREAIEAGESKEITAQWDPPETLPSGPYTAYFAVTVNDDSFTQLSDPFFVNAGDINLQNAVQILQILAGISVTDISPDPDFSGDGKLGIEDVIYALQVIAGLRD